MRALIFLINTTLDGRCDHRDVIADDALHLDARAQLARVDMALFGDQTYKLFAERWPEVARSGSGTEGEVEFARALAPIQKVAYSDALDTSDWNTSVVRGDAVAHVRKLRETEGKGLLLFASPKLAASLRDADLIDEYRFVLQPFAAGRGPELFAGLRARRGFHLLEATPFPSGAVALRYARE
ncbi:MAG: dihydrofolate reductase family protein [Polyangiales bacterium]